MNLHLIPLLTTVQSTLQTAGRAYVKVAAAAVYPARFVFDAVFSSQSRIRRPYSANVDSSLSR